MAGQIYWRAWIPGEEGIDYLKREDTTLATISDMLHPAYFDRDSISASAVYLQNYLPFRYLAELPGDIVREFPTWEQASDWAERVVDGRELVESFSRLQEAAK